MESEKYEKSEKSRKKLLQYGRKYGIMLKIIKGNICYPKSEALIIPANTKGTMSRGRAAKVIKDGLSGISKEVKQFITNSKVEIKTGDCFVTGPGRLNRRGLKKIYHVVIKRLQSDFTSVHIVREALRSSLKKVEADGMKSVTICALGIEPGELDPKTIARITIEQADKFVGKMKIKIMDDNEEFINELNNLYKE